MKIILLETMSIRVEYVGLFILLGLCFIIILELKNRGK